MGHRVVSTGSAVDISGFRSEKSLSQWSLMRGEIGEWRMRDLQRKKVPVWPTDREIQLIQSQVQQHLPRHRQAMESIWPLSSLLGILLLFLFYGSVVNYFCLKLQIGIEGGPKGCLFTLCMFEGELVLGSACEVGSLYLFLL
jgi:hypothetical protein